MQSVSGQDTIDDRANMVTLMQVLASKVCATGDPLWYNGKTDDLPPQVENALEAYVDESHTKSIAIIPLRKADLMKQKASDELGAEEQVKYQASSGMSGAVIGSLVVEQVDSVQSQELMLPRVEEVCQQSARALGNAMEHNDLFMMPVWRTIGKSRVLTTAKNLPKTLLVSGLILLVLLSLFLLRKDFELKADGTLEPVSQRKVFVNEDGFVTDVKVVHGQEVNIGDPLIEMENKQLKQQIEDLTSKIESKLQEIHNLNKTPESRTQQRQSMRVLQVERDSLKNQLDILFNRQKELTIRSPIKGQIGTWQVKNNLLHRPVARGQEVMSIADPAGDWRLEVFLADKRIGHLNKWISENEGKQVEVSYILKSNPDVELEGSLEMIKDSAETHEQHGQSFRLFVSLDKQELLESLKNKNKKETEIKQGTEVIVKLKCGRATLGYAWFHELFEWVETMLFSI